MHKGHGRWCAGAVVAMALVIGCGSSDKGPGSTPTGGSGDDTGGAGGPGTGGTSTGGAGGSVGTGGSGTGGASAGADAGVADSGSASDASGPAAGVERFVGEWDYMTGGAMLTCPGAQPISQTYGPTNYITIKAGSGVAPLILALTGCNLRFDIQGQAAVVQPNQTCPLPLGKPASGKADKYTYTIEGDLLRESSSWTVTFTGTADAPCTLTSQGTLGRH